MADQLEVELTQELGQVVEQHQQHPQRALLHPAMSATQPGVLLAQQL